MGFNIDETGADVSAPSTGAALVISLDGILKSAAKTTPDKILAMMVKLLNQAEQLRLLQRAILRRNHTIKRQRELIYQLGVDFELASEILSDLRTPNTKKENPNV
jgi:hypothetical protein